MLFPALWALLSAGAHIPSLDQWDMYRDTDWFRGLARGNAGREVTSAGPGAPGPRNQERIVAIVLCLVRHGQRLSHAARSHTCHDARFGPRVPEPQLTAADQSL